MTSVVHVVPRWQAAARPPAAGTAYFARGTAIRALRGVTPLQKLLLYTLHTRADAEGVAWPSIATLAEDTGAGRATVFRLLAHLRGLGYLAVERAARGRGHVNTYRLTVPAPAEKRSHAAPEKVSPEAEKVSPRDGKGLTTRPELPRRTTPEELSSARAARGTPTLQTLQDDGADEAPASVSAPRPRPPGAMERLTAADFAGYLPSRPRGTVVERARARAAEHAPGAAG